MNAGQYVRLSIVIFLIVLFGLLSGLLGILPIHRWTMQRWRNRMHSRFCALGLKVMNVTLNLKGDLEPGENFLVVSNHLSYLDILLLAANIPSCFVTSVEIKETPGLGYLTRLAGCLFVERRNKENIHKEIEELTEGLRHGVNVAIFPEATSTSGESVLRFRSPLYNASIDAGRRVLPLCINYKKVGGEELSLANRDSVFWYGDMSFFPHLVELIRSGPIEVEMQVLPALGKNDAEDAKEYATLSHSLVAERYIPCLQ